MDKAIKKVKKGMDTKLNSLIKEDVKRDKALKKCGMNEMGKMKKAHKK